jgi:DNA-binding NtrC family response regulator
MHARDVLRDPFGPFSDQATGCRQGGKDVNMDIPFVGGDSGGPSTEDGRRQRNHILVVDRDQNVRSAMHAFLSMTGCTILVAASAGAGLRFMRVSRPSLVFLDPYLREYGPFDLVREFWTAGHRRTRIVLLGGQELKKIAGVEAMVSGLLAKPFDVRELLTIARRHTACDGRS